MIFLLFVAITLKKLAFFHILRHMNEFSFKQLKLISLPLGIEYICHFTSVQIILSSNTYQFQLTSLPSSTLWLETIVFFRSRFFASVRIFDGRNCLKWFSFDKLFFMVSFLLSTWFYIYWKMENPTELCINIKKQQVPLRK